VDGKEYVKGPIKTKSSIRIVPMLPDVAKRLKEYRKEQLKYRMVLGPEWQQVKGLEDLLFCTVVGRLLSRSVLYNAIDRVIELINHDERMKAKEEGREPVVFGHFSSHTMRHTFATRALENGIPLPPEGCPGASGAQHYKDHDGYIYARTAQNEE